MTLDGLLLLAFFLYISCQAIVTPQNNRQNQHAAAQRMHRGIEPCEFAGFAVNRYKFGAQGLLYG